MLDNLIKRLIRAGDDPPQDRQDAARTAIAAVLVEAARADGVYLDSERATIDRVLAERFGLTADAAARLRAAGEDAQAGATDIVRFTRVLKDAIPHEDRVEVIEAVWRVILADDDREAYEDNLVRRLCGLLYVPDRDSGLARQRVAAGRAADGI